MVDAAAAEEDEKLDAEGNIEMELREPYLIFNGLSLVRRALSLLLLLLLLLIVVLAWCLS